jgi:hypothetical protein
MRRGNVGLGVLEPSEPLVIGKDLGAYNGNRLVIGDDTPGAYPGLVVVAQSDRRGWMLWNVDESCLGIGVEDGAGQWNNMIKLEDGEVSVGVGSGNSSVQLPQSAVSATEILDEPGVARVAQGGPTTLPDQTWVTVCSKSCDFPASGYAVVLVSLDFVTFACEYNLEMGIAKDGTVAPRTYSRYFSQEHPYDDLDCYDWEELLSLHEVFLVDAGPSTFNFLAKSAAGDDQDEIHDISMTVMFFPSQYATKGEAASEEILGQVLPPELLDRSEQVGRRQSQWHTTAGRYLLEERLDYLEVENAELRRRLEALEKVVGR